MKDLLKFEVLKAATGTRHAKDYITFTSIPNLDIKASLQHRAGPEDEGDHLSCRSNPHCV